MKKVFENAIWWLGVVMAGLVLGITLQFVRAWTEPAQSPPGGNLGAPINTGPAGQNKSGVLGVLGLLTSAFQMPTGAQSGYVLRADAQGVGTWQAGVGCYVSYSGGCVSGFSNKGSAGTYGMCADLSGGTARYFRPAGGRCCCGHVAYDAGEAILCCQ